MTNPGAFALISTEHDLFFAHALTTTATVAAASLIAIIPHELVALPLPVGAGTSLDFSLDSHHVALVFENGRDACGALDSHRRRCCGYGGHAGRGEFRILEEVHVDLLGRVEDRGALCESD